MSFVLIANEPGRHGYDVVGPFTTPMLADKWLGEHKLNGHVKELVPPDEWQKNDGSMDDEVVT